jgi:hypothetical protein
MGDGVGEERAAKEGREVNEKVHKELLFAGKGKESRRFRNRFQMLIFTHHQK